MEAEFAEANGEGGEFDRVKWVNKAVEEAVSGGVERMSNSLEKHLSELEMKLNLLAEDVEASLDETTSESAEQIAPSLASIERAEHTTSKLLASAHSIEQRVESQTCSLSNSVQLLRMMHTAKTQFDAASDACEHAAGLSSVLSEAENTASYSDAYVTLTSSATTTPATLRATTSATSADTHSGEQTYSRLIRLAELVVSARSSIESLRGMEGINESAQRLEQIEQKLESQAYGQACTGIATDGNGKRSDVTDARDALALAGRLDVLERAYVSCRKEQLVSPWNDLRTNEIDGESLEQFLRQWHSNFESTVVREKEWCRDTVPQDEGRLIATLSRDVLAQTSMPLKKAASASAQEKPELAVRLHDECSRFTQALVQSIPLGSYAAVSSGGANVARQKESVAQEAAKSAVELTHAALEDLRRRLADSEKAYLSTQLDRLSLEADSSLQQAAQHLNSNIDTLYDLVEASFDRCLRMTAGTEADPSLRSIDESLLQALQTFNSSIDALTKRHVNGGEPSVHASLQMLYAGVKLSRRQHALEASIRSQLVDDGSIVQSNVAFAKRASQDGNCITAEELAASPCSIRLRDSREKLQRVEALLEQASDARFTALPRSAPKVPSLEEAVERLVHDCMLQKARVAIENGVQSNSDTWSTVDNETTAGFSLSPNSYATEVGEHLLMLPQMLEELPLAAPTMSLSVSTTPDTDEQDDLTAKVIDTATRLIKSVAESASQMLAMELIKIENLSEHGRSQLAADAEYVANVNSALGASTPKALTLLLELSQCERESFNEIVQEQCGGEDETVVKAVKSMRGL